MRPPTTVPALLWLLLVACGHPATQKECEEIVERVARLELKQANVNAETLAEEVRIAKESFRKEMTKRCIGRRVTDSAMACVRQATRAEQIEEECFR
jgi:hypothetical protein